MKKKKIILADKTPISPVLLKIWEELWVDDPCKGSLTISKYIEFFSGVSRALRRGSNLLFSQVNIPVYNMVLQISKLDDIKHDLEWLLVTTNIVIEECRERYMLNHKSRRTLRRTQQKNEEIWDRFSKRLFITESAMKKLYNAEETNYSAFEVPSQSDFSIILKDFEKFSFQKN